MYYISAYFSVHIHCTTMHDKKSVILKELLIFAPFITKPIFWKCLSVLQYRMKKIVEVEEKYCTSEQWGPEATGIMECLVNNSILALIFWQSRLHFYGAFCKLRSVWYGEYIIHHIWTFHSTERLLSNNITDRPPTFIMKSWAFLYWKRTRIRSIFIQFGASTT